MVDEINMIVINSNE